MSEFESYKSWVEDVESRYCNYAFKSIDIKYLDGTTFDDHYRNVFDYNPNDVIKKKKNKFRTPFQIERDHILYSPLFHRLADKTQLFTTERTNLIENRLTHTLKVMQISKSIARGLKLNEDLVEAIALGHDIGHPPFAHVGELALEEWIKEILKPKSVQMRIETNLDKSIPPILELIPNKKTRKNFGEFFIYGNDPGETFFMHGRQGFRLLLKQRRDFTKFSRVVLYGIWRHSIRNFDTDQQFKFVKCFNNIEKDKSKEKNKKITISLKGSEDLTYEAQVVRYGDDIAWVVSDLVEGLNNKILDIDNIRKVTDHFKDETMGGKIEQIFTRTPIRASELYTLFIYDLIDNNLERLANKSNSLFPIYIKFSEDIEKLFSGFKQLIKISLHGRYIMSRGSQLNKDRIKSLCRWYYENPGNFLEEFKEKMNMPLFPLHLEINKNKKDKGYSFFKINKKLLINKCYKVINIIDFISTLTDHEVYEFSETLKV